MKKRPKLNVAFVSLTSCEGCSFAVLDQGERLLTSLKNFNIGEFHLITERAPFKRYDVAFVDGAPLHRENIKKARELRKKTKYLIALGDCAVRGVIPNIRNYVDKGKAMQYVYPKFGRTFDNPNIIPLHRVVTVDYEIHGCPIDGEDFMRVLSTIRDGAKPVQYEFPVCYECQVNGNPCLLQRGEPCLGPLIRGGCNAVCLNSGFACKGCRGVLPGRPATQLNDQIIKTISQSRLNEILEIFGIREEWEAARKT
jgi:sulfhydrogenase subunit delta